MSGDSSKRDFAAFNRWLAKKFHAQAADGHPPEKLLAGARDARDEFLRADALCGKNLRDEPSPSRVEVLKVVAAADFAEPMRPEHLTTARGYRVTFAFDETGAADASGVCVQVQCPEPLIACSEGRSPALWKGAERFELGQFDADGKAIGTLPVGVDITPADLAQGRVKLQEPDSANVV